VGDEVYGRKSQSLDLHRHFLHAHRLKIILPGDDAPKMFEAPLPDDLEQVLNQLR
jgi:23S rRNA pseudouridine1911/1915/1917 synthase